MMPTLGTSGPQRQILYSASKGVNGSVGLCFFVATYKNDLVSVGGHRKNTDLQKNKKIMEHFLFFAPIEYFPQK